MADQNQENQADSLASKLKLKLKIPKITNQEEPIQTQQHIGESSMNTKNHFCKVCNRSFSCGKALGGHMSSAHVQAQANKDLDHKKLKSKKKINVIRCKICGRDFHSRKSLFGHMKSHPDRHWRGMDPPDEKSEDSFDYDDFYYSDEDEDEFEEEDNQVDLGPVMDLSASLTGWGAKGKRGRYETDSEPDEEQTKLHAAVQQLIRLVNSPVPKKAEEREIVAENRACEPGPDKMVVCENVEQMDNSMSISLDDGGRKAKRAKVDECVTGSEEKMRSPPIQEKGSDSSVCPTPTPTPGKMFTCNSCPKSFSTYQALGGHRSSHNKPRVSISNTIDEVDANKFGSSSKAKTAKGYARLFGSGKGKKFQGTNLVGSAQTNVIGTVSCNDQSTFETGSTYGSAVNRVLYNDQATFENGSTQGSTVDRVSSNDQDTSADGRTQVPKQKVFLDLNEFPDEDEIV